MRIWLFIFSICIASGGCIKNDAPINNNVKQAKRILFLTNSSAGNTLFSNNVWEYDALSGKMNKSNLGLGKLSQQLCSIKSFGEFTYAQTLSSNNQIMTVSQLYNSSNLLNNFIGNLDHGGIGGFDINYFGGNEILLISPGFNNSKILDITNFSVKDVKIPTSVYGFNLIISNYPNFLYSFRVYDNAIGGLRNYIAKYNVETNEIKDTMITEKFIVKSVRDKARQLWLLTGDSVIYKFDEYKSVIIDSLNIGLAISYNPIQLKNKFAWKDNTQSYIYDFDTKNITFLPLGDFYPDSITQQLYFVNYLQSDRAYIYDINSLHLEDSIMMPTNQWIIHQQPYISAIAFIH